jgi:hypothetical protein
MYAAETLKQFREVTLMLGKKEMCIRLSKG